MSPIRTVRHAGLAPLLLSAAALAVGCGSASTKGELVEASRELGRARLAGSAAQHLGVTYGPYLGVRCRRANHPGCDRVGVDVVFGRPATQVVALVGSRRLSLRTPGFHNGIRYRDWVGTLPHAGMGRPGSPFRIRDNGRAPVVWAGSPPVYVPVEFRVSYADGGHARALFPHVFLSPGWG